MIYHIYMIYIIYIYTYIIYTYDRYSFSMCFYTCLPLHAHTSSYKATPELISKLIITELSALAFGNNEPMHFILFSVDFYRFLRCVFRFL